MNLYVDNEKEISLLMEIKGIKKSFSELNKFYFY